jgi:hypothetical protein
MWANTMREWQNVRDRLHGLYLEVDQADMTVNSARVAGEIREFLTLSDEQRETIERVFSDSRVEQTGPAQDQRQVGLDETGWTDEEKAVFNEICTPMMQAYGYSTEANATDLRAPIELFFSETAKGIVECNNVNPKPWGFRRAGPHVLQLHPNAPGKKKAEVRYLGMAFNNHHRFTAKILLASPSAQPVLFGFRIEDSATRASLTSEEKRLTVETSPFSWTIDFQPLKGKYDVIISTRMAEDAASADRALAHWISPTIA